MCYRSGVALSVEKGAVQNAFRLLHYRRYTMCSLPLSSFWQPSLHGSHFTAPQLRQTFIQPLDHTLATSLVYSGNPRTK